ncbi:MAG: DUF3667 domain-containing protein [Spirosomataceae bacterium]
MTCKNCNTEVTQHYCPNCGQPAKLKRIDGYYIVHEIEHVLHFEKGILYTIRELLTKPGQNVRDYISENRSRLVKPIIFIIVTSLIYSVASHLFHIEDHYVSYTQSKQTTTVFLFGWIQAHYGYSNIMMGVFIAFWAKVFFKKYEYNFFEILILLCFVMGMAMLFLAVFAVIQGITHIDLMQIASMIGLVYCTWAIGQFFDKRKIVNYVKALGAYLLGMLTFFLLVILLGTLVDFLLGH